MTKDCDCILCRNNHEFTLTEELKGELLKGDATIFAGAGISTEARGVLNHTLFERIQSEIQPSRTTISFPELMEEYCRQPNGRFKLLSRIKERFDNINSFPELTRSATRFHRELATFFPIRNIITTNWDTYFEELCNATPFINDHDLAFWEVANRRVLKIHGSIANFGTIVATTSDYEKCLARLDNEIIGSLLKTILATQTVIFIGYSFSDPDFIAIYEFVKRQMNSLHKQAYVVSPLAGDCEKFSAIGLIPIQTDGTFFIANIKAHAIAQRAMLKDSIYEVAANFLYTVIAEHTRLHQKIKATDYPDMIFSAFYQDGMIHALERAINMRNTGEYSRRHHVTNIIHAYIGIQKNKLKEGRYEDVAYIEGYINALMYLIIDHDEPDSASPPLYYLLRSKSELRTFAEFSKELKRRPIPHKAAHTRAVSMLKQLSKPNSVELHHPPWL